MDTLILTLRYILLIETKNYSGTLFFDKDSEQIIQTKDEKDKSYDNPLIQVRMQAWHLKRWLQHHKFNVPPIFHFVVISNPSTIIKTNDRSLNKLVVKGDVLLNRVLQIDEINSNAVIPEKEARKLSKLLIKKHTPHHPDILKTYSLRKPISNQVFNVHPVSPLGCNAKNGFGVVLSAPINLKRLTIRQLRIFSFLLIQPCLMLHLGISLRAAR